MDAEHPLELGTVREARHLDQIKKLMQAHKSPAAIRNHSALTDNDANPVYSVPEVDLWKTSLILHLPALDMHLWGLRPSFSWRPYRFGRPICKRKFWSNPSLSTLLWLNCRPSLLSKTKVSCFCVARPPRASRRCGLTPKKFFK